MIILNKALPPPELPQMIDGVIDIAHLDQVELIANVKQYKTMHLDDIVIFHLDGYLCSVPTIITSTELQRNNFQLKIPFRQITSGEYKAYITVYSYAANISISESVTVTIKNSNRPTPPKPLPREIQKITAEVISNGAPASGITDNLVRISAIGKDGTLVDGIPIRCQKIDGIDIEPQDAITDSTGHAIFSLLSNKPQVTSIGFLSGTLDANAEVYFSETKQADVIIVGRSEYGNSEVVTFKVNDKETLEQISNAYVSYKLQNVVDICSVAQIGSNPDTRNPVITDDQGQFKLAFSGKAGGHCTILICANNSVGQTIYQKN